MFPHEKLVLYQRSLSAVRHLDAVASAWDARHAVVDQMKRAADSIVMNLVEAVRSRSTGRKLLALDYSFGSMLECAACCDVATVKRLSPRRNLDERRQELAEMVRMAVGLRKSWPADEVRESDQEYGSDAGRNHLFAHEKLEVYRLSLNLIEWLERQPEAPSWSVGIYRSIDEALTAIPLNLAEGNGRFMRLHRRAFLDMAHRRASQAAARLDLLVGRSLLNPTSAEAGKDLLDSVSRMVHALMDRVSDCDFTVAGQAMGFEAEVGRKFETKFGMGADK